MKQNVLIVGGGFAGIKAALELAKDPDNFEVTVVSEHEHFRYFPALYRTATGGLRTQTSIRIREIFEGKKITFLKASAKRLDRDNKIVLLGDGQKLSYDILILALGVVTNYFGIQGLKEYSYGIKSPEEAAQFKAELHKQLIDEHTPDKHYVIVGAGPTGIELAGALPAYMKEIMSNHGVKNKSVHIDLIEAAPRLLPRSSKHTSRAVRRQLKKLGIRLYLGQTVQGETADALTVSGKPLSSHTVVWTAGMANNPFFEANNFAVSERHKVLVDEFMKAEDNIYVLGDNAATPFSGMAQTAVYDAKFVAMNLRRAARDEAPARYKPKQPISVIPAGPKWAAVDWGKFHFSGKIGYLLRQAADLVAYTDLEPWWKATEHWFMEFGDEESCEICNNAGTDKFLPGEAKA